ncbi:MAG: DUF6391 domain-containing protein [Atribacterota bacterium]|nr:DUF6391 domain-containing protein [Atribacterota bacterium]MDD4896128.1 DUF6391 domain-containing protein [Atribacterota bacterium]MDD5638214.1 DUF6391 domain-containing protein [Atribacterota bacterium]
MIFLLLLYLFLMPLFFFFIIALIFLPYGFTLYSLVTLITVPKQIWTIAKSKNIRRNHAIEHATINVLEQLAGQQLNISGLSQENGFYIAGIQNAEMVEEAAIRGLNLLKQGSCHLAIHRRCGTDIAIANFITALIFFILLFTTGLFSILNIVIALLLSNLISPYLGEYVQKYFTTSCEVRNTEIVGLEYEIGRQDRNLLLKHFPRGYFIRTETSY